MLTNIDVYSVNWPDGNILSNINNGLWINNTKVALHWPIFSEKLLNNSKYNNDYSNCFYISYDNSIYIEKMTKSYYALNDIVFDYNAYMGYKKAQIYITIEPL
tara:strand:- start:580 stop:888 length:309 start_codon:yes stop_codon:yes gene_type:complete